MYLQKMIVNEIVTLPVISVLCYLIIESIKVFINKNSKVMKLLPIISAFTGAILGVLVHLLEPESITSVNVTEAILIVIISGLGATGSNQLFKHIVEFIKKESTTNEDRQIDDTSNEDYNPFPCIARDACNRVNCIDCPFMQNEKNN